MLSRIFVFLFLAIGVQAFCPKLFNNQTACSCETTVEGPVIKCSGTDGLLIVDKLKSSHLEIKEIALENANIIEIGPKAFKNLRIKKLNLDKNRIQRIHEHAFHGLENVMQELSISENSLQEIPAKSLAGMRVLNILNLKCNKIGNVSDVSFVNMSSLIDVNLACNQICQLAPDTFANVQASLQNLILDSNCFTKIPSAAIKNMNNLIALHLKNNKIVSLERGDLTNLTSLSMLSLNGNAITKIDKEAIRKVPNLRYLYLNDNQIETFETGVMQQFKQVQVLDLSYNNMSEVTKDMFSGLESVQHLNLDSNHIQSVAPGAFSGTPLLLLWLPNNCLTEITQQTFQGALFLRMVSLSNNNIDSIQELSFGHLANLHTLDLAHNKIFSLQNKSLSGAENLAVRLQENPMVCTTNGFHVLNAGEAINLTSEANNICKTNWQKKTENVCPKTRSRLVAPQCCSSNAPVNKKTVTSVSPLDSVPTTTSTNPPVTEKEKEEKEEKEKEEEEEEEEETEYIDEDQEDDDKASTQQEELTKKTEEEVTTTTTRNKKVNMERFWRLSQGPSKKSPFMRHMQVNKPKFLQTTTEKNADVSDNTDSDEADYISDESETNAENKENRESNSGTVAVSSQAEREARVPARIRERQKMFESNITPWISHEMTNREGTKEDFNKDGSVETISQDKKTDEN
uniref:Uncharacterized protein n=1 Tax=Caenorhabditis japonica TaxID=281687 RepID=A0A8R1HH41_CAEJA